MVDAARDVEVRSVLEAGARSNPLDLTGPVATPARGAVAREYVRLGFVHIVPEGLDHILFVLGLFLLSARLRPLVWQVTAFTVAHAVTLTLAALGIVALSPRLVEPLIALSIVYVAVENVLTDRMTRWRPPVVFGFGLLHGLGFAGVLGEARTPGTGTPAGACRLQRRDRAGSAHGDCGRRAGLRPLPGRRRGTGRGLVVPTSAGIALIGLVWPSSACCRERAAQPDAPAARPLTSRPINFSLLQKKSNCPRSVP